MKRGFQFWLIYSLGWLPYAMGYAAVFSSQLNFDSARAVLDSIHNILPAALLGVGVIWSCQKFSLLNAYPIIFGLLQVILAVFYSILWNLLTPLSFSIQWLIEGRGWNYTLFTGYAWQWQFFAGLMIYATIASIVYTLQFLQQIRLEQAKTLRAEYLRTEAELLALRAHLNPHFLFNTLHSLMALVRQDTAQAENAIERLAALLRYTLKVKTDGGKDDVTLSAEWEFVKNYLELERLRLGSRLQVKVNLSPPSLNCVLPALTLQPIVENAIKHAVSPNPSGAAMKINSSVENEILRLEIEDSGTGAVSYDRILNGEGSGLRLIRQRLETRYNGKSEFKIMTGGENPGFRVVIFIPQDDVDEDKRK